MPHGQAPTVFVSSTCYDLRQLRQNLLKFIESLGYTALISENPAFPVNPQANTVDNCIQAVRDRADIFVMVIGERYGHVTPSGRSVTNLEYLEARTKGIPIYIFVTEPIIHLLPVWKKNPTADFTGTVDTPQLFEFVDEVRNLSGNWVYQFKHADDITDTLRIQWAILFTEALNAYERLHSPDLSAELRSLNGASLRIVLQKELGWEFRLLGSVLREELNLLNTLRRDIRFSLTIASVQKLELAEAFHWLNDQIKNAMRYIQSSSQF